MGSGWGDGGGGEGMAWNEKESTWFFYVSWYYVPHARLAHEIKELVMCGEALVSLLSFDVMRPGIFTFLCKIDLVNYKNKLYVSWGELSIPTFSYRLAYI